MKRNDIILLFGFLLSSCATNFNPTYYIDEIVVHNQSEELVHNLTLGASGTDPVLNCAEIAPAAICRDKFARRPLMRNPLLVTWEFGNAPARSEAFTLGTSATLSFGSSFPLRAIVEIAADGSITTYFEQDIY